MIDALVFTLCLSALAFLLTYAWWRFTGMDEKLSASLAYLAYDVLSGAFDVIGEEYAKGDIDPDDTLSNRYRELLNCIENIQHRRKYINGSTALILWFFHRKAPPPVSPIHKLCGSLQYNFLRNRLEILIRTGLFKWTITGRVLSLVTPPYWQDKLTNLVIDYTSRPLEDPEPC